MPKLPGDQSKNTPTNLTDGSKGKKQDQTLKIASGVARTGFKIKGSGRSGRFVPKPIGTRKPPPLRGAETVNLGGQILPINVAIRLVQTVRNQLAHTPKPKPAAPITVRVYLDTDDAVTSFRVVKALDDVLESAGYGKTKIEGVEKGSIKLRIKAWLDGPEGQSAQQTAKNKIGEAANYAEQWAKDATVNKQRAEISAINAKTNQTLMESVKDVDNAAIQIDEWLIVKSTDAQGKVTVLTRKLSVTEMILIDRNPAILNKPSEVLDKLTLLAYEHNNQQLVIEG